MYSNKGKLVGPITTVVKYPKITRAILLELGDALGDRRPKHEFFETHVLRGAAELGFKECLYYPCGMFTSVPIDTAKFNDLRSQLSATVRWSKLNQKTFSTFLELWLADDEEILEFANKHGMLYDSSENPFTLNRPREEPLQAWRIESYLLFLSTQAIRALREIRTLALSDKAAKKHFEKGMRDFWSLTGPDRKNILLPPSILRLVNREPMSDHEVHRWDDIASWVVNYHMSALCSVHLPFGAQTGIEIKPNNLLGGLWLYAVESYWRPHLENRICAECGISINDLPKQSRFCQDHQTSKARQRRHRSKRA
ncbi:MAG: hypothetical protein ACKVQS_05850 [Fimbriimonadaceae bacterium]